MGIPHAGLLMSLADAVLGSDEAALAAAQAAIRGRLGDAVLVDSAGIVAQFNAIDRVADATGTPIEDDKAADTVALRAAMGIDRFAAGKDG